MLSWRFQQNLLYDDYNDIIPLLCQEGKRLDFTYIYRGVA